MKTKKRIFAGILASFSMISILTTLVSADPESVSLDSTNRLYGSSYNKKYTYTNGESNSMIAFLDGKKAKTTTNGYAFSGVFAYVTETLDNGNYYDDSWYATLAATADAEVNPFWHIFALSDRTSHSGSVSSTGFDCYAYRR